VGSLPLRYGKLKLDGSVNFSGVGPKTKAGITRRRKKELISKLDVLDKKIKKLKHYNSGRLI